ncbi:MAG: alpha/beta fold hydrolase [Acidobacteriota bacterium]
MWPWLAALAALPAAGRLYQRWGERRDARRHPPPGRMISGFHVLDSGGSGPPVVLEAGIAASSASWKLVQDALSGSFRVISYDRRGLGYSEAASSPRTLDQLLAELDSVVEAVKVGRPFVLAGHSFGGLLARHYAARFPEKVHALVLLDPLEPFEWSPLSDVRGRMLGRGVMLSRRGATLARWGVVRLGLDLLLLGSRRLPTMLAVAASGKGSEVTRRLAGEIQKLPPEVWPRVKSHWCLPRSFSTMAEYLERLPEYCRAELDEEPLRRIPVHVLSAGTTPPLVVEAHRRWAQQSRGGTHQVVRDSGHWLQLDAPHAVSEAIQRAWT